MAQPVVIFDSVWKKFRRGERHDCLRDLVPALARRLSRRGRTMDESEFWALRDVSFEVAPGEALGIIGPNGAGKSTTLKLLTRILRPTRGHSELRGRVGALIEVAAGFHPDLTGRENVFLQGAIMGMKQAEIARQLDAIVEFAGVREFIDTPVKRYSSGMNARLGFSIAAHLDPQVLVIDEVLAVGDMPFQQRCMERMGEFKRQGVAIVFVSHNLQAVQFLCDRALHLEHQVRGYGATVGVIEGYIRSAANAGATTGSGDIEICGTKLLGHDDGSRLTLCPGTPLTLRVNYLVHRPVDDVSFGFHLRRSTDNLMVYDANFLDEELRLRTLPAGTRFAIDFRFRANVARGHYHLACSVHHNPTKTSVSWVEPIAMLTIAETRSFRAIADLALEASPHPVPWEQPAQIVKSA
jgi:lipopolysaccharide transport system ATP-binding protein